MATVKDNKQHSHTAPKSGRQGTAKNDRAKATRVTRVAIKTYDRAIRELEKH